ncbi:hypothetical protein MLD38_032811 [Melastoma candidum]|uniref:Uncharacterized protein n=1 Tax=Melastoma candidum TaxID=119954 RepID=A0ACB9M4X1_9MYRT|nr:hypothetical protein MLD38_032811 [Melastoma candidum]
MEGSESKAVFEKLLELKPQIFINEVLNGVDDLVDDAFAIFRRQASAIIRTDENTAAPDLNTGVAYLQNKILSVLDRNLGLWEKYSLLQCFNVPEGFCLPERDSYAANLQSVEALADFELEEQLDSLRSSVSQARKESRELNEELQILERQATSTDYFAKVAVELSNQSNGHDMFKEIISTADELRTKILELEANRMEASQRKKKMRLDFQKYRLSKSDNGDGLDKMNLQDLQRFLGEAIL